MAADSRDTLLLLLLLLLLALGLNPGGSNEVRYPSYAIFLVQNQQPLAVLSGQRMSSIEIGQGDEGQDGSECWRESLVASRIAKKLIPVMCGFASSGVQRAIAIDAMPYLAAGYTVYTPWY
ncbi:hypothetical protein GTR04_6662 [Trichophyton interdigitale]|nr:hypothetical protein GY631_7185 [Trichophyton interdigitale]KAG5217433.1 hypothetical protein GY632_6556 [Trichophyton interdigitale]KAG8205950.1 hypothetical protein GTR04_6662 [Trichophyton interdigitale]